MTIVVLTLFAMLLYRLLFIAQNAPDLYGSLIVTGIFAHIALQVVLNCCSSDKHNTKYRNYPSVY